MSNIKEPYSSVEIKSDVPGIGYTIKHKRVVSSLIEYYCKRAIGKVDGNGEVFTKEDYDVMHNRAKCHDMDKIICGLCYPQLTVNYMHRLFNSHHIESVITWKSKYDCIEMIFDWESAPYTKPYGKNAVGVLNSFNKDLAPFVSPYLQLFGFESEAIELLPPIVEVAEKPVYEPEMIELICEFMHTTRIHQMQYMARIPDEPYKSTYHKPAPFRHKGTQRKNGTYFERPNNYVREHKRLHSSEYIRGTIKAQIYDMDALCKVKADEVEGIEAECKRAYENLDRS